MARSFEVEVRGQGRPVVFLPGASFSGAVWGDVLARLEGKIEAHVISIAGFAGLPPVEPPLLARVRDELAAYLESRALCRPVVVGHSLGGALAYLLASTEPGRVGGLVVVDMPPYAVAIDDETQTAATFEPRARDLRDRYRVTTPAQLRINTAERVRAMVRDPARAAALAEESARSSPAALGEALYELWTMDLRALVAAIQAPVIVLAAGEWLPASTRPAREARWRSQLAPIARHELWVIERARHFIMIDRPDTVVDAIERLLAADRGP